jgi:hypothetical protein
MTRRFEANVYKGLPGDEDRGGSPTPEQEKRTIKVGDWVNIETGPSDGWVVGGYPEEEGMVFLEHPATGMTRTMPLSSVRVSEAPQGEVKKERVLLPADVKDVLDMEVEELLSPHTFDFDKTEPVSEDAFRELNRRRAAELTERLRRNFLDFEFPDTRKMSRTDFWIKASEKIANGYSANRSPATSPDGLPNHSRPAM